MKKIIVLSDSHGNSTVIDSLRPLIAENDMLVHLGDGVQDLRAILAEYPEKVYFCAGNCDFFAGYPTEGVLDIEGVRILYCHGHRYGVKNGLEELARCAKTRGCDIALYGHTHEAKISQIDGVTLINPGTMRYALDRGGSYCYLVINGTKFTPVLVGEIFR